MTFESATAARACFVNQFEILYIGSLPLDAGYHGMESFGALPLCRKSIYPVLVVLPVRASCQPLIRHRYDDDRENHQVKMDAIKCAISVE